MLSAENVQKGKSLLAGRVGQGIMSSSINIVDNPLNSDSPAARPMDGEGVRCRKNILVSEGRLVGFMHNTYTANKSKTSTTANASRGGGNGNALSRAAVHKH
jgi:PmbA protein